MPLPATLQLHPEVAEALRERRPVVALESAVATAGLPDPVNREAVLAQMRAVRDAGAVPAVVGILGGVAHAGLDGAQLDRLVVEGAGVKAAAPDLAPAMAGGATAGTTVSGTLLVCRSLDPGPIRVLATGGIGGVHRSWTSHPDVSADLGLLAGTRACVVASGVKSVLDVPATYEALEALAVPVIAYGTDRLAEFYCTGRIEARWRVNDAAAAAAICRRHWTALGGTGGLLLANPVPEDLALDAAEIEAIVEQARREPGPKRTPHLLRIIAERTGGRAVKANAALLEANARLAGEVAGALAQLDIGSGR